MKDLKEETFFEFYDSNEEDNIVAEYQGYSLVKQTLGAKKFLYKAFDPEFAELSS